MEKRYRFVYLFFIFIFLLVPIGFRRYFGLFPSFENVEPEVHFHTFLMTIWCLMLIFQPIFIKQGKHKLHRQVGRISYGIVPFIVLSMVLIISYSFNRMSSVIDERDNFAQILFPITQLMAFSLFYILAIVHRKRSAIHMRYIVLSSIVLLGPTIGRINFEFLGLDHINMDLVVMDICVLVFILIDLSKGKRYLPYFIGLAVYLGIHLAYHYVSYHPWWLHAASYLFGE